MTENREKALTPEQVDEALLYAIESCIIDGVTKGPGWAETAAIVERHRKFFRAALEHFAGERNYASVVDEYRKVVGL